MISNDYEKWVAAAERLLTPLVEKMRPGVASLPLEGMASNHGAVADGLESFARPCLLAGHWLAAQGGERAGFSRAQVAEWFRAGLLAGTAPLKKNYWGAVTNYHQHSVETGALVLALEMARDWLWTPLTASEQQQVLRWFRTVRGTGLHRNNHLFFGVVPLCFLIREGAASKEDSALVLRWMDVLESMYLDHGWFIDGMNETVDHYNAYAFHYYGLWWGKLYGSLDEPRAARWKKWAGLFLQDYAHFFAASGENVPFGRSLTYRFAASAPFGLAHHCGVRTLSPGMSRRLCTQNLDFFLDRLPPSQPLSIGWTDEFPALAEAYSCAGSPYWAAKAFAPLLIAPDDAFWQAPQEPIPAEGVPFSRAMPAAGLVIRSTEGAVELLNTSSGICPGNTAFGTYKWGKTSYRTGVGFEVRAPDGTFPQDAALTAESEDGIIYGRHSTHSLKCADDEAAMVYVLGDKTSRFCTQVESRVWWRNGWQLQLHRFAAHQPARLMVGAYSLAAAEESLLRVEQKNLFVCATNGAQHVALQGLSGWDSARTIKHAGSDGRTHLLAANSVYPVLQTGWMKGDGQLLCLSYCGAEPATEWIVESCDEKSVMLRSADGAIWSVSL